MSDEFSLSDFDSPAEIEDHRVFLDAIQQKAAEGTRSANAPLLDIASEIQRQLKAMQMAERSVQNAAASLTAAKRALLWDRVQQLLIVAFSVGIVLAGAGAGYHFAKAPKIEEKLYGCGSWNARKEECLSGWIPLKR